MRCSFELGSCQKTKCEQLNENYSKEIRVSLFDALSPHNEPLQTNQNGQIGHLDMIVNGERFEIDILDMNECKHKKSVAAKCGVFTSIVWRLNHFYCLELRLMAKWQKPLKKKRNLNVWSECGLHQSEKNGKISIFVSVQNNAFYGDLDQNLKRIVLVLHKRKGCQKETFFQINGRAIPKVIGMPLGVPPIIAIEPSTCALIEELKREKQKMQQLHQKKIKSLQFALNEERKKNEKLRQSEEFWRNERFAEIEESHLELTQSIKEESDDLIKEPPLKKVKIDLRHSFDFDHNLDPLMSPPLFDDFMSPSLSDFDLDLNEFDTHNERIFDSFY